MADLVLSLGEKKWLRGAAAKLGLGLPQALARAEGPWEEQPLQGKTVLLGGDAGALADLVRAAGATVGEGSPPHALVFDARGCADVDGLTTLYRFYHAHLRRLAPNGRIVVIAAPVNAEGSLEAAAAAAAVTGFVKSCAKEIGRKGATANAIFVAPGGEAGLAGPLRFLLSARSAFVDGQTITVSAAALDGGAWTRPLAGRVALVTGAARGIGAVTARRLGEEGAQLILADVPAAAPDLQKVAAPFGAVVLPLDITAADAVERIRRAAETAGGLHVVVNNAGVTRDKTLANMSEEQWRLALDVNLKAALRITEGAFPLLGRGGRTIFLSSIAGIAGNFGQTNYGAAKAGLIGAVRHLAPRFAAQGATVNAVAPGFIETQMTAAIPFFTREAGRRLSSLGQGGLPIDVAEAITFLASPGAGGVNGQVLRVCGGGYLGA